MKALLLGSTGVVVETSRLERLAYNAAFEELGLDLYWNVATYCKLLEIPGGVRRLDSAVGDDWLSGMADEVSSLQRQHLERLAKDDLRLRPGVADVISFCRSSGIKLAWVTDATPEFVESLIDWTDGLQADSFDLILTRAGKEQAKPAPAVYRRALRELDLASHAAIAVEDTPLSQAAALAADLQCYLFPGEYALVDNNVLLTRNLLETVEHAHTLWSDGEVRAEGGARPEAGASVSPAAEEAREYLPRFAICQRLVSE